MRILITGGTRGIGAALARAYRKPENEVAAPGSKGLDVTNPASITNFLSRLNGIDLLICNAGVFVDEQGGPIDNVSAEQWAQTLDVNVTGVALTIASSLNLLRKSSSPKIAIISSQMGSNTLAPGGSYAYRASKAAAINIGRNLATDLKPEGIPVGIYHPGWVQTDMGGETAEITESEATAGLVQRFEELDLESTGCFLTWDGREHPL